jgi:hypothetical protein
MRALIVLSLTAIIFSSNVAEAGMSTGPHKVAAPAATTAPRAPAASHVAMNHRRDSGRVRHAQSRPPGILGPIAAVGGAIGNTVGGLFRR